MLTRCPDCATTFRITPEQLKARQGKVRCGECQHVFNALDSLVEEPLVAVPAATTDTSPATEKPLSAPDSPAPESISDQLDPVAEHEPPPTEPLEQPPSASPAEALTQEVEEAPSGVIPTETLAMPAEEAPAPDSATPAPAATVSADIPDMPPWIALSPPKPLRRWPWILGLTLALLALAAQTLLHFRVELAVLQPGLKPLLQAACAPLGCDVPRPRRADLLGIETSDLHPDPRHKGRLQLVMSLRNRAPFNQELPHLEVTLTDTADTALLVRSLPPPDYLPPGTDPTQGFAANSELALNLTLDVGDLPAAGYRLYLYFP
ncbi:DUF3426 domain-containing protein [Denitratisoma oestradiolicum]|nr:DUF3426 domain-containing protein [Denitratisoma oestradiolicum]TWO81711.1 hypothetical protein CBW56_03110 [Denitratisoma oestradiolicum]